MLAADPHAHRIASVIKPDTQRCWWLLILGLLISGSVALAQPRQKPAYIPPPQPVKTTILIGAHNCPLWVALQVSVENGFGLPHHLA